MDMNYSGGMWEGGGGQDGVKRGKWDNCNNIINKYIKKNRSKKETNKTLHTNPEKKRWVYV